MEGSKQRGKEGRREVGRIMIVVKDLILSSHKKSDIFYCPDVRLQKVFFHVRRSGG